MEITYTLIERLEEIEKETNGELARIITRAEVTRLLTDDERRVVGVEFTHGGRVKQEFGPVVISTGGFGADFSDSSLLAEVEKEWRSLPAFRDVPSDRVPPLRSLPTTNGKHCTGDGIKIARDVGAGVIDMHMVQVCGLKTLFDVCRWVMIYDHNV